jgi:hypothetical protein
MALSQKHRSVLFEYLSPRVGEEVTEALMAEFPSRDGDELVTRDFLRAELAELRAEFLGDLTEVRGDMARMQARLTGTMLGAIGLATTIIIAFG